MTDDRPVIDAPTAEELSGQVPVVKAAPTRSQFRADRQARRSRRSRRYGLVLVSVGAVLVAAGVVVMVLR